MYTLNDKGPQQVVGGKIRPKTPESSQSKSKDITSIDSIYKERKLAMN